MALDRKELGSKGEAAAAAYLRRVGYDIDAMNWRTAAGEIDIVAWDGRTLVLCEVKTRRSERMGTPEDAVSPTKQRRLVKLARAYLAQPGACPERVRFDVISIRVIGPDRALLRHYRAAFDVPTEA